MKTLTVREAETQLGRLVAEAARGDVIVLTDGKVEVTLTPRPAGTAFDLEEDSPELAAELLKTAKGPFTPYTRGDLEAVAQKVLGEKQGQ